MPETVRASKIPSNKPVMTVPTMRPRLWSGAYEATMAVTTIKALDVMPIKTLAMAKTMMFWLVAASSSAPILAISIHVSNWRRFSTSLRGTKKTMPST